MASSSPHIRWKLRLRVSICFWTLDCSRPRMRAALFADPASRTTTRVRSWSKVNSSSIGGKASSPFSESVSGTRTCGFAGVPGCRVSVTGTCRSNPDGLLSCSALALHPIAGPAELVQNVRSYISTLVTVQQNINVTASRYAEAEHANS